MIFESIISVNETWRHYHNPDITHQSME